MSDKTEDILYEAWHLGIKDEVLELAKELKKQYPNMEVGDRFEKALNKLKNK